LYEGSLFALVLSDLSKTVHLMLKYLFRGPQYKSFFHLRVNLNYLKSALYVL
jgi:hypothetical protein